MSATTYTTDVDCPSCGDPMTIQVLTIPETRLDPAERDWCVVEGHEDCDLEDVTVGELLAGERVMEWGDWL